MIPMRLAFAVAMILSYIPIVTVVHELGHASAAVLFGYNIRGIHFGLDGSPAFVDIVGPFDQIEYDIILLSGGLMVALFFIGLALISNRQFILLAPFHVAYGVYEMMGPIPHFIGALMAMSWVVFIAVIVNWAIRREVVE